MRHITAIPSIILVSLLSAPSAFAEKNVSLADNAALRYWSAFSAMQDSAITDEQARELNAILDGTAPYDDSKYKDLLRKIHCPLKSWPALRLLRAVTGAWITGRKMCLLSMPERHWC